MLHPLGIILREAHVFGVPRTVRVQRDVRHADHAQLFGAADRNLRAAVEGVEDLHGGDGLVIARAGGHREDFALPLVRQRVEAGHRPHVVIVLHHVGVEDDLGHGSPSAKRCAGKKREE